LDAGDDILVLDVREPHEHAICNLGAPLIPLGELAQRLQELDPSREIVAHCKGGVRSAKAVLILQAAGYPRVSSLAGGILAWSERIDPTVPKY
jgi:adenylyltransferase/sulfurtransferase